MFTHNKQSTEQCPHCHAMVTDWSARCPKCRYHPDCDERDCYNRAEDDIATIVRYATSAESASTRHGAAWRRLLHSWIHRPGSHAS